MEALLRPSYSLLLRFHLPRRRLRFQSMVYASSPRRAAIRRGRSSLT
ncbi:hypothetical protein LINPERPRIM_LOCUS37394 [Linum perenne]